MANYKIVNGELRHCDDELYHWKYIDKYKKNGKWIYIYDDGEGNVATGKRKGLFGKLSLDKKIQSSQEVARKENKFAKEEARSKSDAAKVKAGNSFISKLHYTARTVDKAADKASKAVSNWGKETVKSISKKSEKAITKAKNWLDNPVIDTKSTKISNHKVSTANPTNGRKRIYFASHTYTTDGKLTKAARKAKSWIEKKLGRSKNTYRTDRLR